MIRVLCYLVAVDGDNAICCAYHPMDCYLHCPLIVRFTSRWKRIWPIREPSLSSLIFSGTTIYLKSQVTTVVSKTAHTPQLRSVTNIPRHLLSCDQGSVLCVARSSTVASSLRSALSQLTSSRIQTSKTWHPLQFQSALTALQIPCQAPWWSGRTIGSWRTSGKPQESLRDLYLRVTSA